MGQSPYNVKYQDKIELNLLRIFSHFQNMFLGKSDRNLQNLSIFWQRVFILQPLTKET